MKRENGSVGSIVFLIVVGVLIWWQWDRIAALFGAGVGGGGSVEVVQYRCERQSDGRALIDGRIRNASDSPLSLRAVTAIYDSSGKKSDYLETPVRPSPTPAGEVGDFRTAGPALPDGGSCKLDRFVDSSTGKPVGYSGHRR